MIKELWKVVKEMQDYEVSNLGRLRKVSNSYVFKLEKKKYGLIKEFKINGKSKYIKIDQFVAKVLYLTQITMLYYGTKITINIT